MKIAIIHDAMSGASRLDELDGLRQAHEIDQALHALGHDTWIQPIEPDLTGFPGRMEGRRPEVVFNLVESVGGNSRLIHLIPAALDALHIPYTGCGSEAMLQTSNKLIAKQFLHRQGVPTPAWHEAEGMAAFPPVLPCKCIVKPVWEDASVGIDDDAVVEVTDLAALRKVIGEHQQRRDREVFAESFIAGREFNLSLLAGTDSPEVLPPAEIEFVGYPTNKPRIVGYAAKWEADSFEYHATPRRFDFPKSDDTLLETLIALARRCWQLFDLRGYARVDFRVDGKNRPWVLEVNANPCLSADAGFMAAADRARLSAEQVVERIVAAASSGSSPGKCQPAASNSPSV